MPDWLQKLVDGYLYVVAWVTEYPKTATTVLVVLCALTLAKCVF